MIDEGYIKFKSNWKKTLPLEFSGFKKLNHFRDEMYQLHLIGAYDNGIGFGNISIRKKNSNQFYISGSATGNFSILDNSHYSLVTNISIKDNLLDCMGSIIASSESMSHAVIYKNCPWVNGVIHIHSLALWQKLLYKIPTTSKNIRYGTPEMALAIIELLENEDTLKQKIFAMAGHEEGIFVFGNDLKSAKETLLKHLGVES
mgnify:CR=1 FL=1